jgi:hypothetical protein
VNLYLRIRLCYEDKLVNAVLRNIRNPNYIVVGKARRSVMLKLVGPTEAILNSDPQRTNEV